jgi:hypothetical protein
MLALIRSDKFIQGKVILNFKQQLKNLFGRMEVYFQDHSLQNWMETSGQLHAPENKPLVLTEQEFGWAPQTIWMQ